jgi:phosphate transport system protein
MARIAGEMVHNVLDAFVQRDAAKAEAVCARDTAVDDFYNSIFRALLTHMMENPHNITPATHLLFVAKNLERIGDHATNVAEMVYFASTGRHLGDRAKGADPAGIQADQLGGKA